ncbi:MAG: hypothetical protein LBU39_08585 [Desulfobulbaceae bacterium]|jgi:phage protein D|nr:hypothetical protein [Desulfobulbaceae bacterium]
MSGKIVRSAKIRMLYRGRDIARYCTDFSYTSHGYGQVDEITARLQDRDGHVWQGDFWPQRGDVLEPVIIVESWRPGQKWRELKCGRFELDEPTFAGPPDAIDLKGAALATTGAAQAEKKTTAWEDIALSDVAGDLAGRNGYKLVWEGKDKEYERLDQRHEGDLAFLERLAREAGNGLKVAEKEIRVIDLARLENRPPDFTIDRLRPFKDGPAAISYSFEADTHNRYKSCQVVWHDTKTGELYSGGADDPRVPSGDNLRIVQKRVISSGEAEALAKESLAAANRGAISGKVTIVGETEVVAGLRVKLTNFGGFSGDYLIAAATHRPIGQGYTVDLDIQREQT